MSGAARLYLGVLLLIGVAAALAGLRLSSPAREAVWLATAVALPIQGLLGWMVVRALGTPSLIGVWVGGMLARVALLAFLAWLVLPLARLPVDAGLLTAASVLFAMLLLECLVVAQQSARETK